MKEVLDNLSQLDSVKEELEKKVDDDAKFKKVNISRERMWNLGEF